MKEFELINKIASSEDRSNANVTIGIGDDCAEFIAAAAGDSEKFIVTADALFEGVHFIKNYTPMRTLGRKTLAVNLSDIAAMGGKPLFHLVTLGVPSGTSDRELEDFTAGLDDIAREYKTTLIGGDTCKSLHGLQISVTAIGAAPKQGSLKRSGAKIGDAVFVSGTLGTSALGLKLLEGRSKLPNAQYFVRSHNDPTPRVGFGAWLAESGCVNSSIDISDGLIQDGGHICEESKVGMNLFAETLPLDDRFVQTASEAGLNPMHLALSGGEDYEILFTVGSEKLDLFEKLLAVISPTLGHRVTKIGEIVAGDGVTVFDVAGAAMSCGSKGFEHQF